VRRSFPFLQVFSGDLPDVQRRGLAVEPMTCAPNAFRSGDGLLRLEPGGGFEDRGEFV
jgi:aldose 1-epimerase